MPRYNITMQLEAPDENPDSALYWTAQDWTMAPPGHRSSLAIAEARSWRESVVAGAVQYFVERMPLLPGAKVLGIAATEEEE